MNHCLILLEVSFFVNFPVESYLMFKNRIAEDHLLLPVQEIT